MNRTTNGSGPYRGFLWNLYERLGVMLQGHPSTVREYRLQDELETKRRDIKTLQARLREVRADNFDYSQLPLQYRDKLADIFCYSREMLRSAARFDVRENRSRDGWVTVTEHCCFCGCDLGVITLPTERDALLYAVSLDVVGYHPPHNSACADCYEAYMKNKNEPDVLTFDEKGGPTAMPSGNSLTPIVVAGGDEIIYEGDMSDDY